MNIFERIAENKILEAIEAGAFDNLPGKGRPLNLEEDSQVPPELRMAYKIMKMADCLPPELEVRREIVQLQDLLAALPDEKAKLHHMRRLNFLVMKLNLLRRTSPLLEDHEVYTPKIIERLEAAHQRPLEPDAGKT
jgi:hypothetical protein